MVTRRNTEGPDQIDLGIRPLTARSVLLSTLLGLDPPELPTARLVATARLLGVEEGTARVALSRMAAAGEVVAADGRYRLAGRLLARQRRQLTGRRPSTRAWRGGWHIGVVTASRRPARERAELRSLLLAGRLAEWREGVWVRPDNLGRPTVPAPLLDQLRWLDAVPEDDAAELAAGLWDLAGWATTARSLLERLEAAPPAGPETLAPGFTLAAAVLRHVAADPLLPPALLPDGWPGDALRAAYEQWDAAYQAALRAWHRSTP